MLKQCKNYGAAVGLCALNWGGILFAFLIFTWQFFPSFCFVADVNHACCYSDRADYKECRDLGLVVAIGHLWTFLFFFLGIFVIIRDENQFFRIFQHF